MAVPRTLEPRWNKTEPVGVAPLARTVAVNVNCCPVVIEVEEAARVVVVDLAEEAEFTCNETALELAAS